MPSSIARVALVSLLAVTSVHAYKINVDFHDGRIKTIDLHHGNITADELLANPRRAVPFGEPSSNDKRQLGSCVSYTSKWYELEGDGNPHQNFEITELADTITSCPDGEIAKGYSHSTGWSFSAGLAPQIQEFNFASLGFDVSESTETSLTQGFGCENLESDVTEICLLQYTAVTALTVRFKSQDICGTYASEIHDDGTGIVYLPNANNKGSVMRRGARFGLRNIIQCQGEERKISYHCGPKGGPEWFSTHPLGPDNDQWLAALDPPDCFVPIEGLSFAKPE